MFQRVVVNSINCFELENLIKNYYKVYFDVLRSNTSKCMKLYEFSNLQLTEEESSLLSGWRENPSNYSPLFNKKLTKIILKDLINNKQVPDGIILIRI